MTHVQFSSDTIRWACEIVRDGKLQEYLASCPPEIQARVRSVKVTVDDFNRMFNTVWKEREERLARYARSSK